MKRYSANSNRIEVRQGEAFELEVEAPGATGHLWSVEVDPNQLEVVGRNFEANRGAFGASGREVYVLRPHAQGHIDVNLTMKAPWEEAPVESRHIHIMSD